MHARNSMTLLGAKGSFQLTPSTTPRKGFGPRHGFYLAGRPVIPHLCSVIELSYWRIGRRQLCNERGFSFQVWKECLTVVWGAFWLEDST